MPPSSANFQVPRIPPSLFFLPRTLDTAPARGHFKYQGCAGDTWDVRKGVGEPFKGHKDHVRSTVFGIQPFSKFLFIRLAYLHKDSDFIRTWSSSKPLVSFQKIRSCRIYLSHNSKLIFSGFNSDGASLSCLASPEDP